TARTASARNVIGNRRNPPRRALIRPPSSSPRSWSGGHRAVLVESSESPQMRLELGPVTFDTDRHQLFRGTEPVHLSTKAFALLALLVERRPKALSKDEIQQALWPDTFVSDTSLTTLVNEIRTVLGESARESRLIRTVHGFGYAFEGAARPASIPGYRLIW